MAAVAPGAGLGRDRSSRLGDGHHAPPRSRGIAATRKLLGNGKAVGGISGILQVLLAGTHGLSILLFAIEGSLQGNSPNLAYIGYFVNEIGHSYSNIAYG